MANIGLCQRCPKCVKFYESNIDDASGQTLTSSKVWCELLGPGILGWDSEVPEGCPYAMEHLITKEALEDLADEARKESQ